MCAVSVFWTLSTSGVGQFQLHFADALLVAADGAIELVEPGDDVLNPHGGGRGSAFESITEGAR